MNQIDALLDQHQIEAKKNQQFLATIVNSLLFHSCPSRILLFGVTMSLYHQIEEISLNYSGPVELVRLVGSKPDHFFSTDSVSLQMLFA